jgi:hypothetical protein
VGQNNQTANVMTEQLIVVDYQEGAGGEFIASWLSAHFGQTMQTNLQANPNYLQKWLNSYSLTQPDWHSDFEKYLEKFFQECTQHNIQRIAVAYHLYKYPEHVEILKKNSTVRFVRINCNNHQTQINNDYCRKVLNRVLGPNDFAEIKFMLQNQSQEKINHCLSMYKRNQLTYQQLVPIQRNFELKKLPSQDVEILYEDFFIDFDRTPAAYQTLCSQLQLTPNAQLLDALIDRNKKNLQHSQII